jgi:transposase
MGTLSKDTIEKWIMPHLPKGKRGSASRVPLTESVECIFYRLKTGCQWREIPTQSFFSGHVLSWNTVFYHWNKWSKMGGWKQIWIEMLKANKHFLDLYSLELVREF